MLALLLLLAVVALGGCSASMIHVVPPGEGKVTVVATVQQSGSGDPLAVDATIIVGGERATLPAGETQVSVPSVPLGSADPPTQPLTVTAKGSVTSFQQLQLNSSGQTTVTVELDAADLDLTGTMSGTVTDSATSDPITNATVQYRLTVGGGDVVFEGATDTNGAYLIGGIPTGNVIATAGAGGYLSHSLTAVVIQDSSPQSNDPLDFQLVPTSTKVTVKGRVIDLITRAPIAVATVTIGALAPVTTRDDGSFEVDDVPVGDQTIAVAATGHDPYSTTFSAGPGMADLQIELAPTESQPPTKPATIMGTVVVTNHSDNSGVTVKAILLATSQTLDTYVTGPSGEYYLWVPPGTYRLEASIGGGVPVPKEPVVLPGGGKVLTGQDFRLAAPAATSRALRRRR